jgi:hypothetical protein
VEEETKYKKNATCKIYLSKKAVVTKKTNLIGMKSKSAGLSSLLAFSSPPMSYKSFVSHSVIDNDKEQVIDQKGE